jgi:hypothetical protein
MKGAVAGCCSKYMIDVYSEFFSVHVMEIFPASRPAMHYSMNSQNNS